MPEIPQVFIIGFAYLAFVAFAVIDAMRHKPKPPRNPHREQIQNMYETRIVRNVMEL